MAGNNLQMMSKAYLKTIHTDGPLKRKANAMARKVWTECDEMEKSREAGWLLNQVSNVKGEFAQRLAEELRDCSAADFTVPPYIEQAVLWAIRS